MRISTPEIEIAFDDVGGGSPLVLLHGFPHDRTLWTPQLRGLSPRCRVVAPDLRGFGETEARPPYTMDRYADDLALLLDALGIARATIGGLSMGGYIAFAFWRRHRARVRALVLADTRAGADDEEGRAKRREMIRTARERGSSAVAAKMLDSMVGATTKARQPDAIDLLRAMMTRAPVDGVVGALEAMMNRQDSTDLLADIDVPTLVLVGDEDVLTPRAEAELMHRSIPGARLEVIPGAGHVSNLERPAAFASLVSEFMDSLL